MKREELISIRNLLNMEVRRRERIKELLQDENVKEYLELTKTEASILDSEDVQDIIQDVLDEFTITESNGIYVCTSASVDDYEIVYQDTNYYSREVPISSPNADHKIYFDIETDKPVRASKKDIQDFEKNNIVLNPHDTYINSNGYKEVKMDFISNAIKFGQARSKRMLLAKYPRI